MLPVPDQRQSMIPQLLSIRSRSPGVLLWSDELRRRANGSRAIDGMNSSKRRHIPSFRPWEIKESKIQFWKCSFPPPSPLTHRPAACTSAPDGSQSGSPVELPPRSGPRRPRGPETRRILPRPAQLDFSCLCQLETFGLACATTHPSVQQASTRRIATSTNDHPKIIQPLVDRKLRIPTFLRDTQVPTQTWDPKLRPVLRKYSLPTIRNTYRELARRDEIASTVHRDHDLPDCIPPADPKNDRDTYHKRKLSLGYHCTRQGKQEKRI